MKVKLIDNSTPRSDNIPGGPSDVTLGQIYVVAENLQFSDKYSIINDKMKIARYSKYRFEIVEDTPPLALREAFNTLTTPMRERIKQLEKQLAEAQGI
jgi:hypothetical protein